MVQDNDSEEEELTAEDRRALRASDEYFRNGGQGIPFQENAAEFGFTVPPPPLDSQTIDALDHLIGNLEDIARRGLRRRLQLREDPPHVHQHLARSRSPSRRIVRGTQSSQ